MPTVKVLPGTCYVAGLALRGSRFTAAAGSEQLLRGQRQAAARDGRESGREASRDEGPLNAPNVRSERQISGHPAVRRPPEWTGARPSTAGYSMVHASPDSTDGASPSSRPSSPRSQAARPGVLGTRGGSAYSPRAERFPARPSPATWRSPGRPRCSRPRAARSRATRAASAFRPRSLRGDGFGPLGDGAYTFSVWAVQDDGSLSDAPATASFVVDNVGPSVGIGYSAAPNALQPVPRPPDDPAELLRSPSRRPSRGAAPSGRPPRARTSRCPSRARTPRATRRLRTRRSTTDATQPTAASSSAPVEGSLVASEPEFRWIGGSDATSGVDRYELQFRNVSEDTAFQTFAQQNATVLSDYVVNRGPGATPALPQGDLLEWRVVTFDNAGNSRNSVPAYRLTIERPSRRRP